LAGRAVYSASTWEKRLDDLWKKIDDFDPDDFVMRIHTLSAELPPAMRSGSSNAVEHETRPATRIWPSCSIRRRSIIQMASSLRNLGSARTHRRCRDRCGPRRARPATSSARPTRRRDDPAAKMRAVGVRRGGDRLRKEDHALLREPRPRWHAERDNGDEDEPFHNGTPPSGWCGHDAVIIGIDAVQTHQLVSSTKIR
jgi:hypothetical protein